MFAVATQILAKGLRLLICFPKVRGDNSSAIYFFMETLLLENKL